MTTLKCDQCGIICTMKPTTYKIDKRSFCSKRCYNDATKEEREEQEDLELEFAIVSADCPWRTQDTCRAVHVICEAENCAPWNFKQF